MKYEVVLPYLMRSLTPLHPGSGARVSGIVDLPIQREAHTGFPVIYGSSLKGALRSWAPRKLQDVIKKKGDMGGSNDKNKENTIDDFVEKIFGPKPGSGTDRMGRALFSDVKLLFFPVKSLKGVFAWVTSPFLLKRFVRDMEVFRSLVPGATDGDKKRKDFYSQVEELGNIGVSDIKNFVPFGEAREISLVRKEKDKETHIVILEDVGLTLDHSSVGQLDLTLFDRFAGSRSGNGSGIKLSDELKGRAVVVHDEMFKHLLLRGMDVSPHIRINHGTNTVDEGGLWYQENLPPETIMYGIVITERDLCEYVKRIVSGYVQLGGDTTTGLGIVEFLELRDVRCPQTSQSGADNSGERGDGE